MVDTAVVARLTAPVDEAAPTRDDPKQQVAWVRYRLLAFEWVTPEDAGAWLQNAFSLSPNGKNTVRL